MNDLQVISLAAQRQDDVLWKFLQIFYFIKLQYLTLGIFSKNKHYTIVTLTRYNDMNKLSSPGTNIKSTAVHLQQIWPIIIQ